MEDKGLNTNKTNEGVRGRWSEPEKHMYAHTHARIEFNRCSNNLFKKIHDMHWETLGELALNDA